MSEAVFWSNWGRAGHLLPVWPETAPPIERKKNLKHGGGITQTRIVKHADEIARIVGPCGG